MAVSARGAEDPDARRGAAAAGRLRAGGYLSRQLARISAFCDADAHPERAGVTGQRLDAKPTVAETDAD
jgi:hypothetical protein